MGARLAEALVTRSHQVSGLPGSTARRTTAAEEAVALCRRLAAERPDRHRVDLARALVARAAAPDPAPTSEAIDQLREAIGYVEDPPDRTALTMLAFARQLLAANLFVSGEVREALTLALRARATWQAAGPLRPVERMRLARTLLVIGDCREALARDEEAAEVRRQALDLHRALSGYQRLKWATLGATAATDLAQSLAASGRARQALDVIGESHGDVAVAATVQPLPGRALLSRALLVEAECRAQLGEGDAAVRLAEQAVDRRRALVEAGAPGAAAGLPRALLVLGELTARTGGRDEAVERLTEAAALARDGHDDVLARALFELVDLRLAAGDRAAVEALLAEATPLCREHVGRFPEVWRPRLARALLTSCALTAFGLPGSPVGPAAGAPAGDRPEATDGDGLAAGREAVELARLLAGADPAHRELLGRSLFVLARAVHRAGDPLGSSELLAECVAVRRMLFVADPAAHRLPLAEALCDLGNRQHGRDRLDEAVGTYRECVDLLRADPERIEPAELLTPLRNLGRTLWRLDRKAEAERVWDEIVAVEKTVGAARSDPA